MRGGSTGSDDADSAEEVAVGHDEEGFGGVTAMCTFKPWHLRNKSSLMIVGGRI